MISSVLASAAAIVGPHAARATSKFGISNGVTGFAPRMALADALRLTAADQILSTDFRTAIHDYRQFVLAADSVDAKPEQVVGLLGELRSLWPNRDDEPDRRQGVRGDMAEQRLAWAVGRLGLDAAIHVLGRVDARTALERDAVAIRAVSPADDAGPRSDALADLFRVVDQRNAIRLHTFQPDRHDPSGWASRLVAMIRGRTTFADRLAEAVVSGQPDTDFLHADDPAIQLVRDARESRPLSQQSIERVIQDPGESSYARAIQEAAVVIRAAGRFFAGKTDADELISISRRW